MMPSPEMGKPGIGELGGQRVFLPHTLDVGALTPRAICQTADFREVLNGILICLSENLSTYSNSYL